MHTINPHTFKARAPKMSAAPTLRGEALSLAGSMPELSWPILLKIGAAIAVVVVAWRAWKNATAAQSAATAAPVAAEYGQPFDTPEAASLYLLERHALQNNSPNIGSPA